MQWCIGAVVYWCSGVLVQWCIGAGARVSDSQLRKPGCASSWAIVFTLHCSSSISCMNEFMAIVSGVYLCPNNLRALFAARLDASPKSLAGVRFNRSAGE